MRHEEPAAAEIEPQHRDAPEPALELKEQGHELQSTRLQRLVSGIGAPADVSDGAANSAVVRAVRSQQGQGTPLQSTVARNYQNRLGADLSGVRIHTGSAADRSSRRLGALAFTVGQDIFFRSGRYQPTTPAGVISPTKRRLGPRPNIKPFSEFARVLW